MIKGPGAWDAGSELQRASWAVGLTVQGLGFRVQGIDPSVRVQGLIQGLQGYRATGLTWSFMGSCKWSYKSPNMDCNYSYATYNSTYNYP